LDYMIRGNRAMRAAGATRTPQMWPLNQHVSGHITLWPGSSSVTNDVVILVAMIFIFVVLPAVWSRSRDRREAAYSVLDLILRFFRR
jgi:hypothetical protein